MPTLGVEIAIIRSGQILLTRREDFETWCLPGGNVDAGESTAQAAMREAREETGLDVQLERLVGIYSMPRWGRGGAHIVVFAARPAGGGLRPQPGEVVAVRYFDPDALPEPLLGWHRQRIWDALKDVTRPALYALRDQSGLSRQEFYLQHFGRAGRDAETLEVG
jgi:ADP-ribose pyrophosphatase YjhB (NUDIX family)